MIGDVAFGQRKGKQAQKVWRQFPKMIFFKLIIQTQETSNDGLFGNGDRIRAVNNLSAAFSVEPCSNELCTRQIKDLNFISIFS